MWVGAGAAHDVCGGAAAGGITCWTRVYCTGGGASIEYRNIWYELSLMSGLSGIHC